MGGDEQGLHGDALHLFIGQGKPRGLDTATVMIGEVAVSGGFRLMKIFSSRISSDANPLGRALSVPAASGGVLILVRDSVYWRLRAVELGDDDDVVFHLARILKQSKQ
jgi:hypothetical protein